MSQTTKKTPFEIVFGQLPNALERFDVGNGVAVLNEEDMEELFEASDLKPVHEDSIIKDKGIYNLPVSTDAPSLTVTAQSSLKVRVRSGSPWQHGDDLSVPAHVSSATSPKRFKSTFNITLKSFASVTPLARGEKISQSASQLSQLIVSGNPSDNVDLPVIDFISTSVKSGMKRKADEHLSPAKKRDRFNTLLEDIKAFSEDFKAISPDCIPQLNVHQEAREWLEPDIESDEPDSEPLLKVLVTPVKIIQEDIDIEDLERYLQNNVYEILNLPNSKDMSMASNEVSDYLEVYQNEADNIMTALRKFEPALKKINNLYVDRLLWLTAETIKRYLKFKSDHLERLETSPRRAVIRAEVHENIKINAERMKRRYAKKKKLFVKFFQIGENVALRIPKEDRSKVDRKRLPAVVVKIKNTTPPMYKLACKFGTIKGYYSTSDIISYPGVVEIANENVELSLREAAMENSVMKVKVTYCKCRKLCHTNRCPCRKQNVPCHSRCHSGTACENNQADELLSVINQFEMPSYGGSIGGIHFSNTCPVDNWLAMLSVIEHSHTTSLIQRLSETRPDFSLLLQHVKDKKFLQAKLHLAKVNSLQLNDRTYDFFGNEKHLTNCLDFMMEYEMISICSNHYCNEKAITATRRSIPAVSVKDGTSVETFTNAVVSWLTGSWFAPCMRRLVEPLPSNEFIHWDFNALT